MEKPKILIVEDDYDTQLFYKLFLRKFYHLEFCRNDTLFYELIYENKFNLIIMDIAIKGQKDGLELTKELRKMENYKNIPIICLSAHVLQQDRENALSAGVNIFLEKPVRNDILLKTISNLLNVESK